MELIQIEWGDRWFMLNTALLGFYGAALRHEERENSDDPDLQYVFVALAEAFYWAIVLDEQLRASDGERYTKMRDDDTDGRVLQGVRYARNLKTHQLPMTVVVDTEGRQYPKRYPVRYREVVWVPAADLPEPDKGKKSVLEAGLQAYEHHLAGRPTRTTLDAIKRWFAVYQNLEGSALRATRAAPAPSDDVGD